jgi:hypothetical protein
MIGDARREDSWPARHSGSEFAAFRVAFAAFVAAGAFVIAGQGTALADTLSFSASPSVGTDSVPVRLTLAGQTTAGQPSATVYWQQAPGQSCPSEPYVVDFTTFTLVDGETTNTGTYHVVLSGGVFPAGRVLLCAYLGDIARDEQSPTGNPPIVARAELALTVQPVHVRLQLHVPASVDLEEPFTGSVSMEGLPSEAQAGLTVDVKPAGEGGCAPTRAQEPPGAQNVITPGGIGSSFVGHFGKYGSNRLCAWLTRVGPGAGTVLAGPVSATILVAPTTGGRPFSGRTSQRLPIAFKVLKDKLYAAGFRLRFKCSGSTSTRHPVKFGSLSLVKLDSLGRFIVDFSGGTATGTFIGKVRGGSASGTLNEVYTDPSGGRCASGRVSWRAGGH